MSVPATGPADLDLCPYRGGATGMQLITDTPPKAQGWSCGECGTQWVTSVVNPHLRPAYLATSGRRRSRRSGGCARRYGAAGAAHERPSGAVGAGW
ncbi:MAG: hypothetical protein ACRDTA_04805 [Pseudonocardiaceae bacterium]